MAGAWPHFWIYVAGPLLGPIIAVGLLKLEVLGAHRVHVARRFHFAAD